MLRLAGLFYAGLFGALGYAVIKRGPTWMGVGAVVRALVALSGCTYLCLIGYWSYAAIALPALAVFMLLGIIYTAA